MEKIDWEKIQKVHFIGIGGIGMSALAQLLLHEKKQVSGSDVAESPVTNLLQEKGVLVSIPQNESAVRPDIDLIVYSDAVPRDNPERAGAQKLGIPTLSYFEVLGLLANQYYLIAVAGAHGKTTTTAMLVDIFEAAGKDPTAVVGSLRAKTKSNFRAGKSKYFIVEADEYMRHFLHFTPDMLVITNIEADHLDYYRNLEDIQDAFRALVAQVNEKGVVVADVKSPTVAPVLAGVTQTLIDYTKYFDPLLNLKVPGLHNVLNAAAALAAADAAGIEPHTAKKTLQEFTGTWRRFEFKGKTPAGALVYDDYAHHPTEIKATLRAARELFPRERITVAFQPHLFSRTKLLFNDFAHAFTEADEVWVAPIFAAREKDDGSITHTALAGAVTRAGIPAAALELTEVETEGRALKGGDVLITMGAGELYKVAEKITS